MAMRQAQRALLHAFRQTAPSKISLMTFATKDTAMVSPMASCSRGWQIQLIHAQQFSSTGLGSEEHDGESGLEEIGLDYGRSHILERLFTDNISPELSDEEGKAALFAGRAWYASELRLKSFEDLHSLWFVLLRERNLLETERLRAKSEGVPLANHARLKKVRKSMARLKTVLKERSLEYEKRRALQAGEETEGAKLGEL